MTAVNQLKLLSDWTEEVINANYQFNMNLAISTGRNLIKFGNYSQLKVNISLMSNCSAEATVKSLQLRQGEGVYNGAVLTDGPCKDSVTMVTSATVDPDTIINTTMQVKVVLKTNILLLISRKYVTNLLELHREIKLLQQRYSGGSRAVNVTVHAYTDATDLQKVLRAVANRARTHVDRVHGIVAVNTFAVQELINSFVKLHDIPLIAGSTRFVASKPREDTLHFSVLIRMASCVL